MRDLFVFDLKIGDRITLPSAKGSRVLCEVELLTEGGVILRRQDTMATVYRSHNALFAGSARVEKL